MKKLNEGAYSLIGIDGNAFSILGYVKNAMRECKHSKEEIDGYFADATSDDYNHLLQTSIEMIEVLNNEKGFEKGHQFTKPDLKQEWESCKVKTKKKKLNEEYNPDTMTLPYEAYNVLTYAISNAFIQLWDEYGLDFSKKDAKVWLSEAVKAFDFGKLSIFQVNENKKCNEEATIGNNLNFSEFYNTKYPHSLSKYEKCIYFTKDNLEKYNISIDTLKNILKNYLFTTYIVDNTDLQIIITRNDTLEFLKLKKELCNLLSINHKDFETEFIYTSESF